MAELLLFKAEKVLEESKSVLNVEDMFEKINCVKHTDFCEPLNCDCFDIANKNIGGKHFDIFVDDCGLFKINPVVSVVDTDGRPLLVGNLIFANHDTEGNTTDLSQEDVETILSSLKRVVINGKFTFVIMSV